MTAISVRYVDLAARDTGIRTELLDAVAGVIDRGQFILGPEVAEFEQRFAALIGVRYAIGVNSGTDALLLALRAIGIGADDEVVTVPNSFVATAAAIALLGARPVFVDVGPDYNMDAGRLAAAIGPRTKAILPVHLTGRPADMSAIMRVATAHDIAVVEDCAQAVLASHRGRKVGSFGRAGCFSLHPLKTLSACGDGGVLVTDDEQLADSTRVMRNIGLRTRDDSIVWSGNSRLDTIQAALLLVKLKHLSAWTVTRRANAARYRELLAGLESIEVPAEASDDWVVYHTFVVRARRRDALKAYLLDRGVETAIHYPVPIHLQSAARSLGYAAGSFPAAEAQAGSILSLPIHEGLGDSDLAYVASCIRDFYR